MYKTCNYIFNDRSSVFLSQQGIYQYIPEHFTKQSQVNRWLDLLETVTYKTEEDHNIFNQIRYIKILTSLCKTNKFNVPKIAQQLQITRRIIFDETKVPLWFGTQRSNKRPFVTFAKFDGESDDLFRSVMNPALNQIGENGSNIDGLKRFDTIYDMFLMTQRQAEKL